MNSDQNCPTEEEFAGFIEGCCDNADKERIAAHISQCPLCAQWLAEARLNERLLPALMEIPAETGDGSTVDIGLSPKALTNTHTGQTRTDKLPSFEGYTTIQEIHRGGQGVVYRAIQHSTKRTVAIKVLLEGAFESARHRLRFEREVDLIASLDHHNIVRIYDSGITRGQPFYAMEYVAGERLDCYVRDRNLPVPEILELFSKVCAAVSFAHQRGVIHRDLKPGNILVDQAGEPRVLDFGLAKIAGPAWPDSTSPVTVTQEFVGTLAYASPEQASGTPDAIDIRTDVYSLGVVLYELLTGHFPYPVVGKIADILKAICEAPPPAPSSWSQRNQSAKSSWRKKNAINDEIEVVVLKALAKEKERRYQSAGELQRDVENLLKGLPIEAKRDSVWYVLRKMAARHAYAASVLAALSVSAVSFGAISYYFWQQADARLREIQSKDAFAVTQTEAIAHLQDKVPGEVNRLALGWFLLEWWSERIERAQTICDSIRASSPEHLVAAFLLEQSRDEDELIRTLSPDHTALAYFAVGERLLKAGDTRSAVNAYANALSHNPDTWLKHAIQPRLAEDREWLGWRSARSPAVP